MVKQQNTIKMPIKVPGFTFTGIAKRARHRADYTHTLMQIWSVIMAYSYLPIFPHVEKANIKHKVHNGHSDSVCTSNKEAEKSQNKNELFFTSLQPSQFLFSHIVK